MTATADDGTICQALAAIALAAGREIMAVYEAGATVEHKADDSPVTEADRRGEAIIVDRLCKDFAEIPIVAEEAISGGHVPGDLGNTFFLVDPLDGTREFINRRGDFTVNIALIRNRVPEIGVVYAPARNMLYCGIPDEAWCIGTTADHELADRNKMSVRKCASPPVIVASRSHRTPETDEFIAKYNGAELISVGSSLKFCLLAEGAADLYPRFGRTMEWDTAAGDAVLRAAGGSTTLTDGSPFLYGKRNQADDVDFANSYFVAKGQV